MNDVMKSIFLIPLAVDQPWNLRRAPRPGQEGGVGVLSLGTRTGIQELETGSAAERAAREEERLQSRQCGLGGGFPPLRREFRRVAVKNRRFQVRRNSDFFVVNTCMLSRAVKIRLPRKPLLVRGIGPVFFLAWAGPGRRHANWS